MSNDFGSLNDALAGGTRWALGKFVPMNKEQGGRILSAEVKQVRDFDSGELQTWEDGNPQKEIVIVVQTSEREDDTDNGERAFHVKTWGEGARALKEALRAAGAGSPAEGLKPGNEFYGKKTGTEQVPGKKFSKNLLSFRIVRNAGAGLDEALSEGGAEEAAAPAAEPAPIAAQKVKDGKPTLDPATLKKVQVMIENDFDDQTIMDTTGATAGQIAVLRA